MYWYIALNKKAKPKKETAVRLRKQNFFRSDLSKITQSFLTAPPKYILMAYLDKKYIASENIGNSKNNSINNYEWNRAQIIRFLKQQYLLSVWDNYQVMGNHSGRIKNSMVNRELRNKA